MRLRDRGQRSDHGVDQGLPGKGKVGERHGDAPPVPVRTSSDEIEGYARGFGLDFFETSSSRSSTTTRCNVVAAYGGFPVRYPHWRFGMEYEQLSKSYSTASRRSTRWSSTTTRPTPTCWRATPLVDQKMVMAHVSGTCDFFKNNYLFSQTNRKMIDEMANHATRVRRAHRAARGREGRETSSTAASRSRTSSTPMSPFITRKASRERAPRSARAARDAGAVRSIRAKRATWTSSSTRRSTWTSSGARWSASGIGQEERSPEHRERDVLLFLLEQRAARALGARHPGDRARRGLLLRAAGPDQDHERRLGLLLALEDHDAEGAARSPRSSTTPTTTRA